MTTRDLSHFQIKDIQRYHGKVIFEQRPIKNRIAICPFCHLAYRAFSYYIPRKEQWVIWRKDVTHKCNVQRK
jgi:hypothetical protein